MDPKSLLQTYYGYDQFRPGDVEIAWFLIESGTPNEGLTPHQQALIRSQDLRRLAMMEGYCRTRQCLRGYLLEHFGQKHPETCGNCGSCRGTFENRETPGRPR